MITFKQLRDLYNAVTFDLINNNDISDIEKERILAKNIDLNVHDLFIMSRYFEVQYDLDRSYLSVLVISVDVDSKILEFNTGNDTYITLGFLVDKLGLDLPKDISLWTDDDCLMADLAL